MGSAYGIKKRFIFTKNTVFLGDNFDLKNAKKECLTLIERKREATIEKCKKVGGIYISGNHSLKPLEMHQKAIRDNILFIHGDIIDWGFKKAEKWRNKQKGVGITGHIITRVFKNVYEGGTTIFRKKHKLRAYQLAKENNCDTIVVGHFHPEKLKERRYKDVRIIIVPRGKTVLDL